MRKHLAANGPLYLLAVLLAVGLKAHYSAADARALLWILEPTARLVSLPTQLEFTFFEGEGFVNQAARIVIAPACAGVNFLIICFGTLVFAHLHRFRGQGAKLVWLAASAVSALAVTLLVNATRIVLSIAAAGLPGPGSAGLLTPERVHRLEGVCVYFLALSLVYIASEALLQRWEDSGNGDAGEAGLSRGRLLVPLIWYLAVTIGVPLARGSFAGNLPRFVEHGATVILLPALLLLASAGIRSLGSRLWQTSTVQWCGGWLPRSRSLRLAIVGMFLLSTIGMFWAWHPDPVTESSFNSDHNGLWVEGRWYTGFDSATGEAVRPAELDSLTALLAANGIRNVYVRAGRISSSGAVEHQPGPVFFELQRRAPDVRFLPWLSGEAEELPLHDPEWRGRAIQSLGRLYSSGVAGVHLDIEPIRNRHPGYVEWLQEIRARFDGDFFVSQATCRVAPFGFAETLLGRYFWGQEFYRATMQACDQTVLMGYNTALPSRKMYCSFISRQTRMLLEWASEVPEHELLIGIPSYDRVPLLFDPEVENVVSASLGVRAALEGWPSTPACFRGVAIYANWTTSPEEWQQYQANWLISSRDRGLSASTLARAP